MALLVKSGHTCYEISSEILEKCAISREDYEAKRTCAEVADPIPIRDGGDSAGQLAYGCCWKKKSLWASC